MLTTFFVQLFEILFSTKILIKQKHSIDLCTTEMCSNNKYFMLNICSQKRELQFLEGIWTNQTDKVWFRFLSETNKIYNAQIGKNVQGMKLGFSGALSPFIVTILDVDLQAAIFLCK